MRSFKDTEGKEWTINLNVRLLREIKDTLDVDLCSITDGALFTLMDNIMLTVDMLHIAVGGDEAIVGEQFAERLGGDSLELGVKAFFESLADFFPRARRKTFLKMLKKAFDIQEEMYKAMDEKIESLTSGDISGTLQDSSDNRQTSTPLES